MNKRILALAALVAPASMLLGQASPPSPLSLRDAAQRALARSPDVAVSQADLASAIATTRSARATLGPQAFVTTTPGYSSGLPVAVAGQVPSVIGVQLHQTLFDPSRRAEILEDGARSATLDAAFSRASSKTLRALAAAYARNWAGGGVVEAARRRLEAREVIFRRVSALAREGRRTDLEVQTAGLEVARAKQKLADVSSERDLDQLELKRLIDWPAAEPLVLAEDPLAGVPQPPPSENLAAARAADPELAALTGSIEAQRRAAWLRTKAWLPVVQAEAQYLRLAKYNNFDQYFVKFKPNDIAVGVSIVIPLWTGGRLTESVNGAQARVEREEAAHRARERDLELAVRRAEAELVGAGGRAAVAERAAGVAREALRVAAALSAEGRGGADEVDLKTIELSEADADLATANQGLLAARIALLDLRGELSSTLLGQATASQPR